jgi:CO/xanthine dehydrogenase Mo-binding subunit
MATIYPVGESIPRKDGYEKVTGKLKYGADFDLPGQLYGKVLHSRYAHARILSIDTSRAAAYPGVRAVITGEDVKVRFGQFMADQPVLAWGKARFWGSPWRRSPRIPNAQPWRRSGSLTLSTRSCRW